MAAKKTARSSKKSSRRTRSRKASSAATKQTAKKATDSSTKATASKSAKSSKKKTVSFPAKKVVQVIVWIFVFVVCLIAVDSVLQYMRYHASVATVNGERISRSDFYDELERAYGTTIVSQQIDIALIYQEAEEKDVEISTEEIDDTIKELEELYGGKEAFEEGLEASNITEEQLRKDIETKLLAEELVGMTIEVTEEEIQEFYDLNKEDFFASEEEIPAYEDAKAEIEEHLRTQKIDQNISIWLVELRADADIQNNIEDPQEMGILVITRSFISDIPDIIKGIGGDN